VSVDHEYNPRSAGSAAELSRWSARKRAADRAQAPVPGERAPTGRAASDEPPAVSDADLPPIESLDQGSDVSGFLSPGVSAELRRLALRKIFHLPQRNIRDGLDDFDEDYTRYRALGEVVTAELRYRVGAEAQRLSREALDRELGEAAPPVADGAAATGGRAAAEPTEGGPAAAGRKAPSGEPRA
jgi:hypothetical protein